MPAVMLFIGFPPQLQISGDPMGEFSAAIELSTNNIV